MVCILITSVHRVLKSTTLFKTVFFPVLISVAVSASVCNAQTFLTADIEKPFYRSARVSASVTSQFRTISIFGSYSHKDYLQFFLETGYEQLDLGSQVTEINGFFLSAGIKNKYYEMYPEGLPFDMAWYLKVDTHFFSESYKEHDLDFQIMSVHLGHIFSKYLNRHELYLGGGLTYSVNNYDGPYAGEDRVPESLDFFIDAGFRVVPLDSWAIIGEVFLQEKPGAGLAVEFFF